MLKSQNESFDHFLSRFCEDSLFQMERISFPLPRLYFDLDGLLSGKGDSYDTVYVDKSKWKFNRLYFDLFEMGSGITEFYDNFDCKYRDTGEMVFRYVGLFTDVDLRYYFKRIRGKWYLVMTKSADPVDPADR